jgi:GH25 family lysozyme M1 (1,4-beta-N-acetylmuramidase)
VSKAPYGDGNLVYQQEGIKGTTLTLPTGKLQAGATYRWNMRSYNSAGWGSFSESRGFTAAGTIARPPSDNPPSVTSFSASASAVQKGETITFSYSVADDLGLTRVELWRADNSAGADFKELKSSAISGKQYSGSFSDIPPSPGTYRYGLHIVDSGKKWNDEKNSQSGSLPGVYGPRQVMVAPAPAAPSVTNTQKPPAPTPLTPGLNSQPGQTVDTIALLTFQWTGVAGADYYALAISESPYGPENVRYRTEKMNGTSCTIPAGTLKPGCKYRWNMQAHSPVGLSDVSAALYFQTKVQPVMSNQQAADSGIGSETTSRGQTSDQRAQGIDLSDVPPGFDWAKVKEKGFNFVFLRATLGDNNPPLLWDKSFETSVKSIPPGILTGAYHFAYPAWTANGERKRNKAENEADWFLQSVGSHVAAGRVRILALDVENDDDPKTQRLQGAYPSRLDDERPPYTNLTKWILTWMRIVEDQAHIQPIIYTTRDYARKLDAGVGDTISGKTIADYYLWIAAYPADPTRESPDPGCWEGKGGWTFWQYGCNDLIVGIGGKVDRDIFNGDFAALEAKFGRAQSTSARQTMGSASESSAEVTQRRQLTPQEEAASLWNRVEAAKKGMNALFFGQSNKKKMVDLCREIIREYPDSDYASKAKQALASLPAKDRQRYGITDEEASIQK